MSLFAIARRVGGCCRGAAGLLLVGAALAGCASRPEEQEGANITHSIGVATSGLEAYLETSVDTAQGMRLQIAALGSQAIDPELLSGGFSPASVSARVHVLVLLNAYETKLAALTESDDTLEDLETAKSLDPQVAGLPAEIARLRDATAARYGAPVASVLAWVGQEFTEAQRATALQNALQGAAPAAQQLLDLLGADIAAIQQQRTTGSADLLEDMRTYYNGNRRRLSVGDRVALAQAMQDASSGHDRSQAAAATALIAALKTMHAALVTYVSSGRTDSDKQAASNAMMQFSETVDPLATALGGR